ncbi:MAG: hypothetical protein E7662_05845, partial [Ruminococcaceae bacterium]|nr:hypothetical protein [Oscillospiraceae bacterium]
MKKRLFSLFLAFVMIAGVLTGFALTAGAAEAAYVRAPLEDQLIRQGTSGVLVPDVFCDPELSLTIEYDVTYKCGDTVLDGNVAFNNWIAERPAGTYEIGYSLDIDETQYTVHDSLTGTFRVTVIEVLFFVGEEPASAENAFVVHGDKLISGNSLADMVTLANGLTARYGDCTDTNPENFILIADNVDPEQIPAGELTVRLQYQGEMDGKLFGCTAFESTITVAAAPEAAWGADSANLTESGTLAEAISAGAAYIRLISNVAQTEPLTIPHSTTLDLNGQFLSVQAGMGEGNAVTASGDLRITDSSIAGNGVLEAMVQDSDAIAVNVVGSISVEGGDLIALGEKYGVSA